MKNNLTVIWFRSDLRFGDNPAWYYGVQETLKKIKEIEKENLTTKLNIQNTVNNQVLPIFILDPVFYHNPVAARRTRYLLTLLQEFKKSLPELMIYFGEPTAVIKQIQSSCDSMLTIYANADYDPYSRLRDSQVSRIDKVKLNLFEDKITIDKSTVTKTSQNLYSVFTPFKNSVIGQFLEAKTVDTILPAMLKNEENCYFFNQKIETIETIDSDTDFKDYIAGLPALAITLDGTTYDLSGQDCLLNKYPYINENEVLTEFKKFLSTNYNTYGKNRDIPHLSGTSNMSIALKWGLVSPRTLKNLILEVDPNPINSTYISELIWREFYKYILYHYPKVVNEEYLVKYRDNNLLWYTKTRQKEYFSFWIKGSTHYSLVDAGIMQLQQQGWMHNRVRMVTGAILTKNLGVNWRYGQEYFRAMLLDLDEASNNGGWQWCASTGADPKPIRIFNPYIQEEKFDKEKLYQRKFLPKDYNYDTPPIIEHPIARDRALLRYKEAKESMGD